MEGVTQQQSGKVLLASKGDLCPLFFFSVLPIIQWASSKEARLTQKSDTSNRVNTKSKLSKSKFYHWQYQRNSFIIFALIIMMFPSWWFSSVFLATSSHPTSSWPFLSTGQKQHICICKIFLKRFSAIVFPIAHRTSVHRTRWLLLVAWTLALFFSAPQWNSIISLAILLHRYICVCSVWSTTFSLWSLFRSFVKKKFTSSEYFLFVPVCYPIVRD